MHRIGITPIVMNRLIRLAFLRPFRFLQAFPRTKTHRSVNIRVVSCGSNGAAEQEIQAMFNPYYDAEQFGYILVTSPRHADVLLLTGPLTRNMEEALLAAFEAMPEPRRVVTMGDDFGEKSVYHGSYATMPLPEPVQEAVVAHIPGDPSTPEEILRGLMSLELD